MQDDAAALAHCAGFALRVFAKADSEDRAGVNVGRATARGFIVASQFLQMLECLGGKMEDGVVEKIRYAKWRAAEILRAVREGREPERPKDEAGDGNNVVPDIAGLSVSPSPSQSLSSPPPQPQSQPQPQPHPHPMDTLPAVPRSTVSSPPPAQQQQQPRVSATPSTPQPSLDRVSATFTPVAASSLPQLHDSDGALLVDPADAKTAQKHARWAISALEYDDVEAAVENLRKAIDVLQPYRKAQD
ncbi:hypothetical protein LPJ73_004427 [Coemansia sp. RSA 2703]|nr:hypothetical protein LPJ73_004427 [Coemansia sp. RSA 2703]